MRDRLNKPVAIWATLVATCLTLFWLTFRAPVSYANGDARLSLLVSLAIIEKGTVKLDAYEQTTTPPLNDPDNANKVVRQNGNLYYAFPIGSSVLMTPAVGLARLVGRDLTIISEQNRLQNGLASLSTALIFVLLYQLARSYLPRWDAWFLAALFTFGSMLISTLGTALWSHHVALGAVLLCLLVLTRHEVQQWFWPPWWQGAVLGSALFVAYWTRPSLAVFVLLVLGLLWWRDRPVFWTTAILSGSLFALFVIWSQAEFGSWFPFYYRPERLETAAQSSLLVALYGQILSPSRGLLVFAPYILLPLFYLAVKRPLKQGTHWIPFVLLWTIFQLIVSSRAAPWWSGWSFGPRIQLDFWPGLLLLIFMSWEQFTKGRWARPRISAFMLLGLFSIWIHTYEGLYNIHTPRWNGVLAPNIDTHPEMAFDWSHLQIGTSATAICSYHAAFQEQQLADMAQRPIRLQDEVRVEQDGVLYVGWTSPAPATPTPILWSECEQADVRFVWSDQTNGALQLDLLLQSSATNTIEIAINGAAFHPVDLAQTNSLQTVQISVAGNQLVNGRNTLTFKIPGAGEPISTPPFRRGIGLQSWTFRSDVSP